MRPGRCGIGASAPGPLRNPPSKGSIEQARDVSGPIVPAPPDPAHRIATVDQKRPIFSQKMTGTGGCGQHMAIQDH